MLNSISFCGLQEKMVRIFCKDAAGKIAMGDVMSESAAKNVTNFAYTTLSKIGVLPENVKNIKYIRLKPDATVEDAKKAFEQIG